MNEIYRKQVALITRINNVNQNLTITDREFL